MNVHVSTQRTPSNCVTQTIDQKSFKLKKQKSKVNLKPTDSVTPSLLQDERSAMSPIDESAQNIQ